MQVKPSQKTQNISYFKKRKLVIILIILIVSLFFLSSSYFLSDQSILKKRSNPLVTNTQHDLPQGVVIGQDEQGGQDRNNVYFGPIQLKNSGYITNSLDSFVKENNSTGSSNESDSTMPGGGEHLNISFEDFLHHPIDSISELSTSFINDYVNNGRKTTLIKLVDAISRYYVTYNRFPITQSDQPSYDWVDEMVNKNEMSGVYSYVLQKTSPVSDCGDVEQTGYCYDANDDKAIIFVQLNQTAPSSCGDSQLFFLWSSEDNKLGEVCLESPPSSFSGFTYIDQ